MSRQVLKEMFDLLPEGAKPQYPLRTRLVHCAQAGEAAAEEVLEHMMSAGEPENVSEEEHTLALEAIARGLAAFCILSDICEERIEDG